MKSVNVKRTYEKPKCNTIQIETGSILQASGEGNIPDEGGDVEIG